MTEVKPFILHYGLMLLMLYHFELTKRPQEFYGHLIFAENFVRYYRHQGFALLAGVLLKYCDYLGLVVGGRQC